MSGIDDLKSKIKDDIPASSIIGNYVTLQKRGKDHLALCPFHSDSNPSMRVNDTRKGFMCFACNTGGDAITFVQKFKSLNFKEALEDICRVIGLNFDDYNHTRKSSPKEQMAQKILQKAQHIYRKVAVDNNSAAYKDFLKNRGLSDETAKTFSIGHAPENNVLSRYLESINDEKERAFALKTALEVGVIRQDTKNAQSHFDTFRERIMFPIWDQFGHIKGFGGRATKDYQKAKYMNSQESFAFNKKNILYGLNLAKPFTRERDRIILVEGYMDLIALHHHGFQNSAAVMGVALSEYALQSIQSLTKNIFLALDSDAAGMKAMERINALCLEKGVVAKYINFAPHKDPDEFLQKEGKLALQTLIDEAPAFIDVKLKEILPNPIPELPDQKLKVLEQGFAIVSPLGNNMNATERLIRLAENLGLRSGPDQIQQSYSDFLARQKKPTAPRVAKPQTQVTAPIESDQIPLENLDGMEMPLDENGENGGYPEQFLDTPSAQAAPQPMLKAEINLVSELIKHPECLNAPEISELLDFIGNSEVKEFILQLREFALEVDENELPGLVSNLISHDRWGMKMRETVGAALFKYQPSTLNQKVVTKLMTDLKYRLQEETLKQKRQNLKNRRENCQTKDELNQLMQDILCVEKELNTLRSQQTKSF